MKKLLVFGLALAMGLSACNGIFENPFDPIPSPYWGWQYVQAKTANGTPLCALNNAVNTNGSGSTIVAYWTLADVFAGNNLNGSVSLPDEVGKTVDVTIETTLSHWTVEGLWIAGNLVKGVTTRSNDPNAMDGVTKVTMSFPGYPDFELSWYEKMLVMPNIPGVAISDVSILKANRFSSNLTIKRLTPDDTQQSFTIVVKASGGAGGWVDIRYLWEEFSYYAKDCYTAFRINMGESYDTKVDNFWADFDFLGGMPTVVNLDEGPIIYDTELPDYKDITGYGNVEFSYSILNGDNSWNAIVDNNILRIDAQNIPDGVTSLTLQATVSLNGGSKVKHTPDFVIDLIGIANINAYAKNEFLTKFALLFAPLLDAYLSTYPTTDYSLAPNDHTVIELPDYTLVSLPAAYGLVSFSWSIVGGIPNGVTEHFGSNYLEVDENTIPPLLSLTLRATVTIGTGDTFTQDYPVRLLGNRTGQERYSFLGINGLFSCMTNVPYHFDPNIDVQRVPKFFLPSLEFPLYYNSTVVWSVYDSNGGIIEFDNSDPDPDLRVSLWYDSNDYGVGSWFRMRYDFSVPYYTTGSWNWVQVTFVAAP